MTSAACFLLFAGIAPGGTHYTLTREGDSFTLSGGAKSEQISLQPEEKPAQKAMVFRKGDVFAVWDHRGLTLRRGSNSRSYQFSDFPVDPRFFDAPEIEAVQRDVKSGVKSLEANGLSGSRRIGQRVYFLVRWSDRTNKPWLEALVQIDLDESGLEPRVLGKFSGLTGAVEPIEGRLFLENGGLAAVTVRNSDWGLSSYSFASRNFDFVSLGERLIKWYPTGIYLEQTGYDSKVGGILNISNFQAKPLFEDRGQISWLDGETPPVAVIAHSDSQTVRNCDSGLEQTLSAEAAVRRTSVGILAWSPAQNPKHAVLLSYDRWSRLAAWNEGGLTTPRRARKRSKRPR